MKPASVKLLLRHDKRKKDGTAPIWLRITANRRTRYFATGIYIEPKYWNENKQQVRTTHDIAPRLNHRLKELTLKAEREALDAPSAQAVKSSLSGTVGSLTRYFQQFIDELNTAGRFWEWKKYKVTLGKLESCFGQQVNWQDVDRSGLVGFETYLRQTKKNNVNTVRKELQRLGRVYKQAIRDGAIKPDANPFLIYDRPKAQKPNRRKLSIQEIQAISNLAFDEGTALRLARDAFLLAFYGGGIRFGDVCLLRPENINAGRLEYRMMKTGNPVSVPLPSQAIQLLEPYLREKKNADFIFPFLRSGEEADPVTVRKRINSKNVVVNKQLKAVAKLANIADDGLTMHVARHSFADFARSKSGDVYAVSKVLGHSSLQVTQQYLKSFDQDAVDRLAVQLWS